MKYYKIFGYSTTTYYKPLPDGTYLFWGQSGLPPFKDKWLAGLYKTWKDRVCFTLPSSGLMIEEVSRLEIIVVLGPLAT